ncbi:AraC family transcriptional regulator [Bradyrhizobium sp. 14AA]
MAQSASGEVKTWSTGHVEEKRRLDYWIGAVCECFLKMDITTSLRSDFNNCLSRGQLDAIGICRVQGPAQRVFRRRNHLAPNASSYYYLVCQTDGVWAATQSEHSTRLQPYDLVLLDSRRCYEFDYPETVNALSLELPTAWLDSWITDPDRKIGQRIEGRAGWGSALSTFVRQMSPQLAIAPPLPAKLICDQLGGLLALALESEIPATIGEQREATKLLHRVNQAIHSRYAEPGLTASVVAEHLLVSERTLHRCLNKAKLTFNGVLNEYRIAIARRMLSESRFDHIGISGIGMRVGLSDPSHFIRQCRRYLGMTPGAFRRDR